MEEVKDFFTEGELQSSSITYFKVGIPISCIRIFSTPEILLTLFSPWLITKFYFEFLLALCEKHSLPVEELKLEMELELFDLMVKLLRVGTSLSVILFEVAVLLKIAL